MSCTRVQDAFITSTASTAASTCSLSSQPQQPASLSVSSSHVSECSPKAKVWPHVHGRFQRLFDRLGSDTACRYHFGEKSLEELYEESAVILGTGASGDVVLAHSRLDSAELVAVKTIEFSELQDLESRSLLERELEILASVDHPKVMGAIEVFESKDRVSLVMPCMQGGDLHNVNMAEVDAIHTARQMLEALSYLHKQGIVHRDVKPSNVVVDGSRGTLSIIDFGLAAFWKPGDRKMQLSCGTCGYMSPEMRTGKGYTQKTDMWSLGITLYELLLGEVPFHGDGAAPQQADVDVLLTSPACSKLSTAAKHFLAALLARDPSTRPCADEAMQHPWLSRAVAEISTDEDRAPLNLWQASLLRRSEDPTEYPNKSRWADLEDSDDEEAEDGPAMKLWQATSHRPAAKGAGKVRWADLPDSDDDFHF